MNRLSIIAFLSLTATSVLAQNGTAPYTVAESGRGYGSLQQAVDAIGQDQGTIVIRPGSFRDCAVQTAGQIAFKAAVAGQTVFDGGVCEGKATLVLRGGGASVDGIVFQNIGVADGNGAGIRLEKSNLAITRSIFRNSEQGILTGDDEASSITIDQTTFSGLGRCDRGLSCAHSVYIGNYGSLSVTNSRFERGNGGHYLKSRAARIAVRNNAFDDTRGKETNYMIDLSNGAVGSISGNEFVQGESKENYSAFITVAPEGKWHSSAGLSINDNDANIAKGVDRNTTFVANWTDDPIALGANRLGRGLKPTDRR